MECQELVRRLDARLETDAYADLDASANGLQVGPAQSDVDHVAFAVDGVLETITRAADAGADLLVTHHGISWDGIERVTGREYDRIAALVDHDLALYTCHLPLDGHQKLGNAAGVADLLDLEQRQPFGALGGEYIGQRGQTPEPVALPTLRDRLDETLDTGGQPVQVLDFGPEKIQDVAVVTGGGADWFEEAIADDVDVFVTGEGKQKLYHQAREAGIHVVLGGHYATETFGVRSLQELVEEWGIETTYIDCPTGL